MKQLLTLVCLLCTSLGIAAAGPVSESDSLVLLFGNKTRMVIHSTDKNGIQELAKYDLNRIIREMGMKLDSTEKGNNLVMVDQNNSVRYLRDTVIVVTRKDGQVTVTVRESGDERVDRSRREDRVGKRMGNDDEDYSIRTRTYRQKNGWSRWSLFSLSIGLNALVEQNSTNTAAVRGYEQRPIGSRFVALSIGQRPVLIRGRSASLSVYYGVEVAWNNFMFENNYSVRKDPTGVTFFELPEEVKKTKLTVATLGIPFVPRVSFYNASGKKVFHLGAGPYITYRIDSYTKVKYQDDDKDRFHSDYYLNDFRYGIMTQLGLGKANIFARYDLNPLFKTDRGPDLRVLSFGLTL